MAFFSSSNSVLLVPPAEPGHLAYAAALAAAAERMGDAAALDQLWPLMAEEALALIEADGAAIVEYVARSWFPLAVRTSDASTATDRVRAGVDAAARDGLLTYPGVTHDVEPGSFANDWRSVLVVGLDRRPSRVSTRLLWFADRPGAFTAYAELADLAARHASAAARAVTSRETLSQAVAARHRIGQAQGILMARRQLTAEQAFTLLQRRSQGTNTKLRTIAEDVILTGDLARLGVGPGR